MSLGSSLAQARRKSGRTQEEEAEKLGVSRQTISKWELDETLPDINQSKKLAVFYHLTLDQLIGFDVEAAELEQVIENTSQEVREKIDWTQLWAKQYPVLAQYQERVDLPSYTGPLAALLDRLRQEQGYNEQDAFLVLKDILGQMWTKGAAR
ncbi:helix-turn-helix transcriptional regulator [Oscillospiraceae bacterium 42-9]